MTATITTGNGPSHIAITPDGTTVSLVSNDPSVSVPSSVVIPAGSKTADFSATTTAVADTRTISVTTAINA